MLSYRGVFGASAIVLLFGLAACGEPTPPPTVRTPVAAQAAPAPQAAPNVADLRGARASSGESEMLRRGFTVARVQGLTQFWIHEPSRSCVRTVTSNGRYQTVQSVPMSNCPT